MSRHILALVDPVGSGQWINKKKNKKNIQKLNTPYLCGKKTDRKRENKVDHCVAMVYSWEHKMDARRSGNAWSDALRTQAKFRTHDMHVPVLASRRNCQSAREYMLKRGREY